MNYEPIETAPLDGSEVTLVLESRMVWDELIAVATGSGWRRVSTQDRVIGWVPNHLISGLKTGPGQNSGDGE
jgi:hypothetical protein